MLKIITFPARFSNRINNIWEKAKGIFTSPIFLALFIGWQFIEFSVVMYNLVKIFLL